MTSEYSEMKQAFYDHLAPTSPYPLAIEVERAEGIFIWDKKGKRYTDMVAGIAVCNLGHRHPKVIQAIQDQLEKYLHVMPYGEFIQAPQVQLAEKLAELLPANLDCSYFVNSGAESIEAAMKLAKRATGRVNFVACHRSYHGSTHGALSVTGNEQKKFHVRPLLPGVSFMRFNHSEDIDLIDENTAAVIIEPIQGDAGVRLPDIGYLDALRIRCTEVGALLIFDEIQTGMGRTGSLFAFEQYGVVPDIICIAKALGGGMPIGAFIASKKLMHLWTHSPMLGHITTFGGHPVNCAAAFANITALVDDGIIDEVEEKGMLFEMLLKHKNIKEVRRKGLMMAVEFDSPETVQRIVKSCLERGVITFWFLSDPKSFRLQPPLIISNDQIKECCAVIIGCCD
jgi:acetylornithine/N-succinyldiaminopimelate aminotransferase